jgi:hypothetical protein
LSYSREQFYFAESLALALQAAKVDVWFDVQRLSPGANWQAGIEQGLAECNSLILVASRAALKSPYVRHEWETVLNAEHRVDVAFFEGVRLPPELEAGDGSIIDMRADFESGVARLVNNLESGLRQRDPVPHPDRLGIPQVVPPEVRHTTHLLAANALAVILLGTFLTDFNFWSFELVEAFFDPNTIWFFPFIAFTIGVVLLILRWRVLRRAVGYRVISLAFHVIAIVQMFVGLIAGLIVIVTPDPKTRFLGLIVFGITAALVFYSRRVTNVYFRTQNLLRWMPRGAATSPERSTLRGARGVSVPRQTAARQPVSVPFRVHFHTGDTRLARQIVAVMQKYGHVQAQNADQHLALITRKTDPREIEHLVAEVGSLIPIIAENIRFEKFAVIKPFQVVDYRRRNRSMLNAFAQYLRDPAAGALTYGVNVTPQNFSQTVRPSFSTRFNELQEAVPFINVIAAWSGRIVIGGMVAVTVISLFNVFTSPTSQRLPTPFPTREPTTSFVEMAATNDAIFGSVEANQLVTIEGAIGNLRYTLGGNWQTADGVPTDPDLLTMSEAYSENVTPLWSAVRFDTTFDNQSPIKLVALRFEVNENVLDRVARMAGDTPIPLTMSDPALTGHYVRLLSQTMSDGLTQPYSFVVESESETYAIHALVTGVEILSRTPPLEILEFVQSLST